MVHWINANSFPFFYKPSLQVSTHDIPSQQQTFSRSLCIRPMLPPSPPSFKKSHSPLLLHLKLLPILISPSSFLVTSFYSPSRTTSPKSFFERHLLIPVTNHHVITSSYVLSISLSLPAVGCTFHYTIHYNNYNVAITTQQSITPQFPTHM